MLSLEGTSSELVKDKAAGGDVWRAKQDPGWRVERTKDADNGDNDGEYWVVRTPQGMTFTFGRGKQATTGTAVAGLIKAATRFYDQAGVSVAVRQTLGNVVWQLNDTQGSAQLSVADGTGVAARTYYSPYGEIRNLLPALPTEHGWLGKTKDPTTGLSALGARYYDASLGRFLSTDPAMDDSSAQMANPYSYAGGNPITYLDPTGLWSLSGAWNAVKSGASVRDLQYAALHLELACEDLAAGGVAWRVDDAYGHLTLVRGRCQLSGPRSR